MNPSFHASKDLNIIGFECTDLLNPSLSFSFFYFADLTHAFDEDGRLWEKVGTHQVPEYFERTEPVLWEPLSITAA